MAKILLILPVSWVFLISLATIEFDPAYQYHWGVLPWVAYALAILSYLIPTLAYKRGLNFRKQIIPVGIAPRRRIEELILMGFFLFSVAAFSVQVHALGAIPLLHPANVNVLRSLFALPVLHHIVMFVNYYIFYIAYQYYFDRLYYKKSMALILAVSVFMNISYATKYSVLFSFMPFLYFYVRKRGFDKKIFCAFVLLSLLIYAAQVYRGYAELATIPGANPYYEAGKEVCLEFIVPFENFAHWIEYPAGQVYEYGKFTFFAVLAITHLKNYFPTGYVDIRDNTLLGGGRFNSVPLIMSPYMDFGLFGIPIIFFLYGLLGVIVIRRYQPGNRFSEFVVFSYFQIIALSFYSDFFINVTFYYNIMLCFVHFWLSNTLSRKVNRIGAGTPAAA